MSLFQSIIIEKYVRELDNTQLETAWQTYSHCFLNLSKQDNIRLSKEEQYQEGFLRDLFVDVFGYTLNPNPDYDITTEFKNQTGSKKADGAILKDGHAIGVIELKGMNTTDLSKIEQQAFGYKNNQPKCRYVITSNFQKLRLYIDNAVEFIEFNLFTLTQDDFALLYLLLHRDGIMGDLPAKLKSASLSQEEAITKQLYKDYSVFKRELFNDLTTNNPSVDNLVLFQKSQKLLDRLLFIFFAEDSHLLPANFAKGIISEWEQLKSLKMTVPLYDRVKAYFGYLDKGHKDEHSEIFAYNGGLFSTDELLDSVIISDNILYTHIKILSEYDFDSEVDVNILGHIFENSLSELDEVKAQLEGTAVDKSQTKRKKDGVFYTPKYITKYIVENTVGKLCTDKKLELGINEEDYQQEAVINKDGTKRKKTDKQIAKEKVAFDNLNAYRDWLLQITICDPAVGSGAFLNEALNFLIAEHEYIVELETKLFGSGLAYPDIENSILENNLFGVDINEESVDIAKLSLWLRTAQPRRKLNNLNDNIQCGNSLIDDPAVAGDKAFNWQTAFPQVFAKGGFDVVIGNPPYVRIQTLQSNYPNQANLMNQIYKSATGKYDLYCLFIEKSHEIINPTGYVSFILPHKFLVADFGRGVREYLLETKALSQIIHFGSEIVFDTAATYTCIITLEKKSKLIDVCHMSSKKLQEGVSFDQIDFSDLTGSPWSLLGKNKMKLLNKIKSHNPLSDICEGIYQGLITTGDDIFMLDGKIENDKFYGYSKELNLEVVLESSIMKKVLKGQNIKRYLPLESHKFLIYPHHQVAGKTVPINEDVLKNQFPLTYAYLYNFKDHLISKKIRYKTNPTHWYSLHRSREIEIFERDYIITPQLQNVPNFTIKATDVYADAGGYLLVPKKEYETLPLLGILNSRLLWFFISSTSAEYGGGYFYFKTKYLEPFTIPTDNYKNLIDNDVVKKALEITGSTELKISSFVSYLQNVILSDKLSLKLQSWYDLSLADFIKELSKAVKATNKIRAKEGQSPIAELTKTDEFEWMELFESQKQEVVQLKQQIKQTEQEIDQMVYKLYDLTDDEIAIIEAS